MYRLKNSPLLPAPFSPAVLVENETALPYDGTFQEQNKRKLYPERLAAILKASFTGYNHSEAYLKCVLKRSASQCLRQRTYLLIISRSRRDPLRGARSASLRLTTQCQRSWSRSGCFADREYRSILYMATSI